MRRLAFIVALSWIVAQAFAITPALDGGRVGVLQTAREHAGPVERSIRGEMPKALTDELRRAGLDARLLTKTIDEVRAGEDSYDFFIEVVYYSADAGYTAGIGAGAPVGSVGVGAEVALAYAQIDARFLIYNGTSLELIRTLDLQVRTTSPALSAVGVGGRDGFLYVRLPFRHYPHKKVMRALARSAAAQIAAQ